MSDDELLKIRNFGEKSLVELREKLAEHGVKDPAEGTSGTVGEISPEDLGELMGDERTEADLASEVPVGMSLEESNEPENEDEFIDEDPEENED